MRAELAPIELPAAHGRHEDVGGAPEHALGHARRAAGVEDVEIVGRGLGKAVRRDDTGQCLLVVEGARQQRAAGVVGDLEEQGLALEMRKHLLERGRELRVVEDRSRLGVAEQVRELLFDVAVVHVQRRDAGLEGAEHALEVLVAVVGVDGQVVLPRFVPLEAAALALCAESVPREHGGQAPAALGQLPEREPAIAEDHRLAIGDRCCDGVIESGEIELHVFLQVGRSGMVTRWTASSCASGTSGPSPARRSPPRAGSGSNGAPSARPCSRPTRSTRPLEYPLLTVLHGAGRQDELLMKAYKGEAERRQAFFLIPRSLHPTWDLIVTSASGAEPPRVPGQETSAARPDADFLEYALDLIYRRYPIDSDRQALVGYSDGASYALSVGLANPELFRALLCWAAGFVAISAETAAAGTPRPHVLLEYGTHDELFPFEQVAVPMRQQLEELGCAVHFRVDEGGRHWPSGEFQDEALDWFFSEPWQERS